MAFYGDASESDFWREFTNNFATDLAPIISLFGEQVTKQYLTESTTFLDSLVFAIAPLGVITAVVSVIRVRGTPFLRSLIGRSREPHGAAELELCSSTSQDVSEMWSNGGVCRVLGRPKILEFMSEEPESVSDYRPTFNEPPPGHTQWTINYPTCGVHLVKDVLNDLQRSALTNHGWTEITSVHSGGHRLWHRWKRVRGWVGKQLGRLGPEAPEADGLDRPENGVHQEDEPKVDDETGPSRNTDFAPYPNLSLNLGSRGSFRRAFQLKVSALAACAIQASFFGYTTWATWYSLAFRTEPNATEPLPFFALCTSGTIMVTVGMTLSAMLIDRNSYERLFVHKPSDTPRKQKRPRIFWLQPGEQRLGDQVFPSFSHNEQRETYITSWKTGEEDSGSSIWRVRFAVICSLLGWICQFVGLRGLHASIGLYHLGVTLIMSVIRAILRSGGDQPRSQDQLVPPLGTIPPGHELDWQALQLAVMRLRPEIASIKPETGSNWLSQDRKDALCSKPSVLPHHSDDGSLPDHFNYFYKASKHSEFGVVGLIAQPWHRIGIEWIAEEQKCLGLKEAAINVCQQLETLPSDCTSHGVTTGLCGTHNLALGTKSVHIRSRLARLAASSWQSTNVSWDTEVRRVSRNLAEAIRQTLEYLEPTGPNSRKHQFEKLPALYGVIWCTTLHLSLGDLPEERSPVAFYALQNGERWQVDETALEAAIGLQTLVHKKREQRFNKPLCPWCGEPCSYASTLQGREKTLFMLHQHVEREFAKHLPQHSSFFHGSSPCPSSPKHKGGPGYFTFPATSSMENLVAQDIYAGFLERLFLISFGLLGLLGTFAPGELSRWTQSKSLEPPTKLAQILLSCNLASETEARITVYGPLLARMRGYQGPFPTSLDRSIALADRHRIQGDNMSAELELTSWNYVKLSDPQRARCNRAVGDLLRVRSAYISAGRSKRRALTKFTARILTSHFSSRMFDLEEKEETIILKDKELDEGYSNAAAIFVKEQRIVSQGHDRVLLPLEKSIIDELESQGRTSVTIGKALSLTARYSIVTSNFDVRCRLFRYALEHGLIGLLQDLYGEELQLPSSDKTVRGGSDQILLAVSRKISSLSLHDILYFLQTLSSDEKEFSQAWPDLLDPPVAVCISDDANLADLVHGARTHFPSLQTACVPFFGNMFNTDPELSFLPKFATAIWQPIFLSRDSILEFFYTAVRWGQVPLMNFMSKDHSIDYMFQFWGPGDVKMYIISEYGAAMSGLTREEEAWATRHGLDTTHRGVPRAIRIAVLKFVKECRWVWREKAEAKDTLNRYRRRRFCVSG